MVKSMTGFGRAGKQSENFKVTVELKAVNHRYLETLFRMPRVFAYLESKLKKSIAEQIKRGRVECAITIEGNKATKEKLVVNWDLADEYIRFMRQATQRYQMEDALNIQELLLDPRFLEIVESSEPDSELEHLLLEATLAATKRLDEMREAEGNELALHFKHHLDTIAELLEAIQTYIPEMEATYRAKLENRLLSYVGEDFDKALVLSEIAIMLEKSDINEEIERLGSHMKQFSHIILRNEPIGRKLDFLIQEMNREVNTIGSKASHLEITNRVVELKTTLEKMREQIQNVE
ncbi:YicC/YloC family endoribonuclease [Listeria booriae]|uniref:YicC family protein n=1 Tax=Listeria booriae TaxID=1552123 RepID=A0A7X1CHA8_9LIST|nr:YicC/YloC family endoribonuclease [Listeria booriae]MBC1403041.1 YicC family protein [Listeria booriae]MBC1573422.1 YicC family protein [Listeria booriae]MBC1615534.1 YicC family protein [Listeria booriae]MBC1777704.1 YicC family protein [Listeria booriae]MBC1918303.1 YicC family protein [Listeria booriae]